MKTEARIYLILDALAFIAFCAGSLVFSAQHVITCCGPHQGDLDPNPHTDCAEGIHFFATREQAVNWGNANFGINAAM